MHDHHSWDPDGVAEALRRIIDYLPLTRDDLARAAGVHRSQVSRWATGRHRPGHDAVAGVVTAVRGAAPDDEAVIALAADLARAAGYPQVAEATEEGHAAAATSSPSSSSAGSATIHEDHGPRPGSELGENETLTWQRIDEARTRYRLDRPDGSGALMTAPADASQEEVLAALRDQIARTIG